VLEAVALGTPVIASQACGLEHTKGIINVPVGDVELARRGKTTGNTLPRL
jgi:hypothetical protein